MNFATCFPSKGLSSSKRDDYLHLHIIYHQINQKFGNLLFGTWNLWSPGLLFKTNRSDRIPSPNSSMRRCVIEACATIRCLDWYVAASRHWSFFFPCIVQVEGILKCFCTFLRWQCGDYINMADVLFFLFFCICNSTSTFQRVQIKP